MQYKAVVLNFDRRTVSYVAGPETKPSTKAKASATRSTPPTPASNSK